MGYFRDTLKGFSWMGMLRGSTRLVGFARIAILARLLSPLQFGIYGIASLVLAFLEILTETGINVFLIQEEKDLKEYVDTAWIVSIIRGFLISFFIYFLAPIIARFFNSSEAIGILRLISVVPLLRGFINPSIVKFQKELAFNKEFFFRFSFFTFDAIVAIAVALVTKSAASFVWGLIAGVVLEIFLSFVFVKPTPRFILEIKKAKKVINRGKWLTAAGFFNYLFHQGDDAIVGKLVGTDALGGYQVAYKISTLPIYEVGEVVGKVTFPVYTKIKGSKKRLRKAFIKVALSVSALVIPFGFVLFVFAQPVVLIVLGEKWLSIIPVVKALAIFGSFRAIIAPTPALFLAVRKQEYVTGITLLSLIGMLLSIFPLVVRYGVVGAAYSAIIGSALALPLVIYYLLKVLKA